MDLLYPFGRLPALIPALTYRLQSTTPCRAYASRLSQPHPPTHKHTASSRLLAEEQYLRGWDYPLHLGVTEAGEGEDGRMKSAIGIGALLMDGLGDTIRVSLTEDPEYEMDPCRRLATLGTTAAQAGWGVPAFEEHRDTHLFSRRVGQLPEQRDDDKVDYRPLLHRDGSVLSVVDVKELQQPE
jgi:(E)-4-hydroxy-3-methylbut-2-enyl-diphosphate synthase